MPRGGKRAGAGRPATGAKQVASFTLSDEAQAKLEQVAKRHGTSKSAALEQIIMEAEMTIYFIYVPGKGYWGGNEEYNKNIESGMPISGDVGKIEAFAESLGGNVEKFSVDRGHQTLLM